jgi:hypothetical protein
MQLFLSNIGTQLFLKSGNKEAILAQAKQQELQEMSAGNSRPTSLVTASSYDPRSLNYDRTCAAFTKV